MGSYNLIVNYILSALYSALTFIVLKQNWKFRNGPLFWFPLFLWLMAIGTFIQLDYSHPSDEIHVTSYFIALISFYVGFKVFTIFRNLELSIRYYNGKDLKRESKEALIITFMILVLSIILTAYYYALVGYNLGVNFLIYGYVEDYSTQRINMYGGENYFAPGYFNQFKNVLLPLTSVACGYWLRKSKSVFFWPYVLVVVPFVFFALIGTGQRSNLVFPAFALLFGLALVKPKYYILNIKVIIILVSVFFTFIYTTQFYKDIQDISESVSESANRIFFVQQSESIFAFRVIYEKQITWFSEWWSSVVGILPGIEGSTLSHDLHYEKYGTARGTIPPSPVGSAYHNGGIIGVVIYFHLLGFLYGVSYYIYFMGNKTFLRSLTYGSIFFYLSAYVSGGPVALIDNGLLTLFIFVSLIKLSWLNTSCHTKL